MHRVMRMYIVVCLVMCAAAAVLVLSASSQEANSRERTLVAQRDELKQHESAAAAFDRDQKIREQAPVANKTIQRIGFP